MGIIRPGISGPFWQWSLPTDRVGLVYSASTLEKELTNEEGKFTDDINVFMVIRLE